MAIADGVYKVVRVDSYRNPVSSLIWGQEEQGFCMDCVDSSQDSAIRGIGFSSKSNTQCVGVTTVNGATTLTFGATGFVADVRGRVPGQANIGDVIQQHKSNNSTAQQWTLTDTGSDQTFNGTGFDLYNIFSVRNGSLLCGERSSDSYTVLQTPDGDNDTQEWFFLKDSYYDQSLPVPASLGAAVPIESDESFNGYQTSNKVVYEQGVTSFIPGWICDGEEYQIRYRYHGRLIGESSWDLEHTSDWLSPSGTKTDSGWGNAWDKNTTCNGTDNVKVGAAIPIPSGSQSGMGIYDKMRYVVEVRRWNSKTYRTGFTGGHGTAAQAFISILKKANVTIDSAVYTPIGLELTYTSDYQRNNNSITFSNITYDGKPFCDDFTVENAPYTGTVTIPLSGAFQVPIEGDNIKLDYSLTTEDGVTSEYVGTQVAVTYGTGGGLTFDFTQEPDGNNISGSFGETYATEGVYLVYQNDGKWHSEPCEKVDGSYRILPPFNVDYRIIALAVNGQGRWGIRMMDGEVVNSIEYVWNWDDNEVSMWVFFDQFGVLTNDYTRSTNSYKLNGRDFDSVFYDTNSTSNMRIVGAVPLTQEKFGEQLDDLNDFFRLRRADYALFRDPEGGRYHVAILTMNRERHDIEFYKVTLTMREYS